MQIEQALCEFVEKEIAFDRQAEDGAGGPNVATVAVDEPLLDSVLDSMDVMRLVVFVEERFDVRIEDDELVPENFASVARLADLVREKLPA